MLLLFMISLHFFIRWLDPLTPMLTQLTYAGLLDEIYGIGMKGSVKVSYFIDV